MEPVGRAREAALLGDRDEHWRAAAAPRRELIAERDNRQHFFALNAIDQERWQILNAKMTTTSDIITAYRQRRERPRLLGRGVRVHAVMAFTTVPTPLWSLFAQRDRFSSLTVTLVFAAYAVAVALSLFLVGHLSDWYGRRRVLALGARAERPRRARVPGLAGSCRGCCGPGPQRARRRRRDRDGDGVAGGARRRRAGPTARGPDRRDRGEPRRARARRTDLGRPRAVGRPRPHASVPRFSAAAGARAARDRPRRPRPRCRHRRARATGRSACRCRRVAGSILRRCRSAPRSPSRSSG